jgi:hypothetical protein
MITQTIVQAVEGDSIDSALSKCTKLLEELDETLVRIEPLLPEHAPHGANLPQEHGDMLIEEIARQCRAIDLERADPETTVARMLEERRRARALRDMLYRQNLAHARLRALCRACESHAWRSALTFYAVLRRTAERDPSVYEGLTLVRRLFKRGGRRRRRLESGVELVEGAGSG